jgi:hypothetical protein
VQYRLRCNWTLIACLCTPAVNDLPLGNKLGQGTTCSVKLVPFLEIRDIKIRYAHQL